MVTLNADIGEGFGRFNIGIDAELLKLINSCNIACGMHAGDPTVMHNALKAALHNNVSIGAHPGFNDLWGFGRRDIVMDPNDIRHLVAYQIAALAGMARSVGTRVSHVKPHGALYNMAHVREDYATAVAMAVRDIDEHLVLVSGHGSLVAKVGAELGLRVACEICADRRYAENGQLISREAPYGIISDASEAAKQVISFLKNKGIVTASGRVIPADIHTICIHGDHPDCIDFALAIRNALTHADVGMKSLPSHFL
jgi:UPF0271 protein